MTDIENRLRDALSATAETVDERRLKPLPQRRPRPVRTRSRLVPVYAAFTVLILVAGFLGIRYLAREPDRQLQKVPTMPRFLFASHLAGGGERSRVEVRDSATGRVLDRRFAPKGVEYKELAVSGDNRTLFVTLERRAARSCSIDIAKVAVNQAGRFTGGWTRIGSSIAGETRESGSLAVTDDGRRLAYSASDCVPDRPEKPAGNSRLGLIDVASGTRREWRESHGGFDSKLAWSARGDHLFFVRSWSTGGSSGDARERHELRAIPVAARSGRVVQVTRRIRVLAQPRIFEGVAAGYDGRTVFVVEGAVGSVQSSDEALSRPEIEGSIRVLEVSVADGRVLRSISREAASFVGDPILKGDASGRFLVTSNGLIDLARDTRAMDIKGVSGFYDLDW